MKPVRSLLFVPADRAEWVRSAPERYDADAVIYDLEDAIEPSGKAAARETLAAELTDLDAGDTVVCVRVNPPGSGHFDADLDAVVRPALDAVVVPKLPAVDDVRRTAHVLDHLESVRERAPAVDVVALPETPQGFQRAESLCAESDRVAALVGASSPGGDIERALGFEWTREGRERTYLLSKLVMDGRSAGVDQFVAGPWVEVDDLDGLRDDAKMARRLGYTGYMVVHPSHVEPVNEVFTPDEDAVARGRRLVAAFEEHGDDGVFRFEGEMVDAAHREYARQLVERARAFDVEE